MTLEDLGYNTRLEKCRKDQNMDSFNIGRVISEHKDRYVVKTDTNEFDCELIGNLRFTAESRYDLPVVGDWVAISEYDTGKALIHSIYPRHSVLERQAVGQTGQKQIIAANIDYGLIVQSVNRDFNLNRLERYLTLCNASQVAPIIILSKIDLLDAKDLKTLQDQIKERIKGVPIIAISNLSDTGSDTVKTIMTKGKTYCLLGSSGVGKSTLLNKMTGRESMRTAAISQSIDRGKHTTSHRELLVLESGGVVIDNPGMREVGITDTVQGLQITFDTIIERSQNCKFKNCTHSNEQGCAILEAVAKGEIDADSYANFQKIERERAHFESSVEERRKKDKDLGKMIKSFQKQRRHNKY